MKISSLFSFFIVCISLLIPLHGYTFSWNELEKQYQQFEYTPDNPYIQVNPFGRNPLVAIMGFSLENPASVSLVIKGKNGEKDLITHFSEHKKEWTIPVYGLYPKHQNQVDLIVREKGKKETIYSHKIKTDAVPASQLWYIPKQAPQDNLFYFASGGGNGPKGIVFDEYGNIRFFFNPHYDSRYKQTHILHNLLITDYGSGIIEVFSLLGEKLKAFRLPSNFESFQHDIGEGPNRTLLIIGTDKSSKGSVLNKETSLVYDKILVTNLTGKVIKLFDMATILNPDRSIFENPFCVGDKADWLHLNSVQYLPKDNSLLISGKFLGIFKVDYETGALKWMITPHLELGKSGAYGKRPSIADKALTAVNAQGKPYPIDVQQGFQTADDFHWPTMNHSVNQTPSGIISIFSNNGPLNNKKLKSFDKSEALFFKVDEKKKTVQLVKKISLPVYAPFASSVVSLDENETFIFAAKTDDKNTNSSVDKFYRYNIKTGQKQYESDIYWKDYFFHAKPISFQKFSTVDIWPK